MVDGLAKAAAAGQRFVRHERERIRIQAEDVAAMATWLAMATVEANAFRLADGVVIRDSTASSNPKRRGLKRKHNVTEGGGGPGTTQAERIAQMPRMVAVRDRQRARAKQSEESFQSCSGVQGIAPVLLAPVLCPSGCSLEARSTKRHRLSCRTEPGASPLPCTKGGGLGKVLPGLSFSAHQRGGVLGNYKSPTGGESGPGGRSPADEIA